MRNEPSYEYSTSIPRISIQINIQRTVATPETKNDKSKMSKKSLSLSKIDFRALPIYYILLKG